MMIHVHHCPVENHVALSVWSLHSVCGQLLSPLLFSIDVHILSLYILIAINYYSRHQTVYPLPPCIIYTESEMSCT